MDIATTAKIVRRRRRNRGGSGAGLQAPDIAWTVDIGNLLPVFSITYDARVGDIITIRRTQTTDFSTYEDASDAVESLDPPTSLEFDFGGDWGTGPWRVKCFYIRSGRLGAISDAITIVLEANGLYIDFTTNEASIVDVDTPANDYTGAPGGKLTETVDADGTYINSAGVITQATANTLRYDYNPSTLALRGLLVEEGRTNLLLNSLIDGTNITTQSVTVSAIPYTLSFYGTGTLTLSGVSTAGPLVGTGAYPNRVTLTFTPTAGSLTITRSGTVQYAQIEAGSFATSFIPTAGSAVARASDSVSLAVSAFNFSASTSTIFGQATWVSTSASGFTRVVEVHNGLTTNRFILGLTSTTGRGLVASAGSTVASFTPAGTTTSPFKQAMAMALNDFAISVAGGAVTTDTGGAMPTGITGLQIGGDAGGSVYGALWIQKVAYVPRRMTNAELQALST